MADTSVARLPPMARFELRGPEAVARNIIATFGVALPPLLLTAERAGARAALWLGPDEWRLLAEAGAAAPSSAEASVVEISDGQVAFRVAGDGAADLLNEFCPIDLSEQAFPPGACTRTLFGKSAIVLWRPGPEADFHVEVGRSFAAYVAALLDDARRTEYAQPRYAAHGS